MEHVGSVLSIALGDQYFTQHLEPGFPSPTAGLSHAQLLFVLFFQTGRLDLK